MWMDVVDLHEFYRTAQGRMARRLIRQRLRALWPDVRGDTVVGVGYATPYLGPFAEEAERAVALMPTPQGVIHWPADGPNAVALIEEGQIPLADLSVDRVVLVHMVEFSIHLRPLLRELWRVLAGGGRLVVVAANRRSIWARMEGTPFSHGRPWSMGQLSRLLSENMFAPVQTDRALHVPPIRKRVVMATAPAWEKIGGRWFPALGAVNIVEATKQIYAGTPVRAPARLGLAVTPSPSRGATYGATGAGNAYSAAASASAARAPISRTSNGVV